MRFIPILVGLVGLAAVPAALAQCCGAKAGSQAGCSMAGQAGPVGCEEHAVAQTAPSNQNSAERHVFMKPVQTVFDNYIKVQNALAQDSIDGVGNMAAAMAQVTRGDSLKRLSPKIAEQADALARATDLDSARAAFKPLSESLIGYLKEQKPSAGSYYVAYCPMAKASWIQTNKTIVNPYMGKSMIHCGQLKS